MDKRHLRRMKVVQSLYRDFFTLNSDDDRDDIIDQIYKHKQTLDDYIDEFAKIHTAEDLAKVDLAILRLAVYELLIEKNTPPKVVINEAVDLAKEFGSDKSPAFVNAILGGLYTKYKDARPTV